MSSSPTMLTFSVCLSDMSLDIDKQVLLSAAAVASDLPLAGALKTTLETCSMS